MPGDYRGKVSSKRFFYIFLRKFKRPFAVNKRPLAYKRGDYFVQGLARFGVFLFPFRKVYQFSPEILGFAFLDLSPFRRLL